MSTYPRVQVTDAPGYEDFEAELILRTPGWDERGDLCIVGDRETLEVFVIPLKCVTLVD